jgi:hypothetical protein
VCSVERDSSREKHDDPSNSTLRGIGLDASDEDENADDSIRINREFDSNEIDVSDLLDDKLDFPRVSISVQRVIDDDVEKLRINR